MACVNSGEPTHINRSTGKESKPTFSHASLLDKIKWETKTDLGSDHKPIIITYDDQLTTLEEKPKYGLKMKESDWEKYAEDVENKLPKNLANLTIDKLEKKTTKSHSQISKSQHREEENNL